MTPTSGISEPGEESGAPAALPRGAATTLPPYYFWTFVVALAVGFHARIAGLASESLWLDEAYTIYWSRQPLWDILTQPAADAKLFILLQKVALAVAGQADIVARLVPVAASLLTTVFVFKSAEIVSGNRAWLAASLYLVYPVAISWSRIGRAYSLLLLAASIFLWFSLRFLRRADRAALVGAFAAWIFVLYAHKSGYFLAPLLLALLAMRPDFARRESFLVAVVCLLAVAAGLPAVVSEIKAAAFSQGTYTATARLGPRGVSPIFYPLISIYSLAPPDNKIFRLSVLGPTWATIGHCLFLVPAALALALWITDRSSESRIQLGFLLLWIVVPTAFMAGLTLLGFPVFIPGRNDLALVLPLILVPIHGLALATSRTLRATMLASMTLSLGLYYLALAGGARPTFRGYDRLNATRVSEAMTASDSCVFVGHIYFSYERYFGAERSKQCTTFGVSAALNPSTDRSVPLEQFLPERMTAGAAVWVMAPRDGFEKSGELDRVRQAVETAARAQGLRVEERSQSVQFDGQGKASVVRLSLTKDEPETATDSPQHSAPN